VPVEQLTPYDTRIARDGVVPTREGNVHDAMNALVWATFPRAKRAVHERQARLVGAPYGHEPATRARGVRSREHDALAMFDEGSVVLVVDDAKLVELSGAVLARDDRAIARATACGEAIGVLFGHALYEHLALGRTLALGALAVLVPRSRLGEVAASTHDFAQWRAPLDAALSEFVRDPASLRAPEDCGLVGVAIETLGVAA
jgi:hypothetical protein